MAKTTNKKVRWRGSDIHSMSDEAAELGLSQTYFFSLYNNNPEAFRAMEKLGSTPKQGYLSLMHEHKKVRAKMEEMYWELEAGQMLRAFGRYLTEKGLYSKEESFGSLWNGFFAWRGSMTYNAHKKYIEILQHFEEWKQKGRYRGRV